MKYVIDSNGEAVELSPTDKTVKLLVEDIRINELHKFTDVFLKVMGEEDKHFAFMIQPFYTKEYVLYFTRTLLSSSSQAVKIANEIDRHTEIQAHQDQMDFYKSIFRDESEKEQRWYYLCVGCIAFERNMYDCKRINVASIQPVPYQQFFRELPAQLLTPEETSVNAPTMGFVYVSNGIPLPNAQGLLQKAFDRDIEDGQASAFDYKVQQEIERYKERKGYANKDGMSNRATTCIAMINETRRNVFPTYLALKNAIKKVYENATDIKYNGNKITAQIDEERVLEIYVSGNDELPQFIIGGKVVNTFDELRALLASPVIFQKEPWFEEKVLPYIRS